MNPEQFDGVPLWGLLLAMTALLWLAMECAYRIGRWRHSHTPDEKDQPVGAMVGSILGILALVLGFTFSLAATRFEARRQTVLEEANAIGTAYLRARLLPEPERNNSLQLLREYVDVRVRGVEERQVAEAITKSEELQQRLWAELSSAVQKAPNSAVTEVYIKALNDVIDLHAKRVMVGLRNRIPLVIWIGLLGLAGLGMAAVGYQSGLTVTRRSPMMLGLLLAFGTVLLLIADLDRAHEGLLRVGQQALVDVQTMMQNAPPEPSS